MSLGLEEERTADVRRLVDALQTALETRRDVDAFAKGKHSKGSGSKGADLCKNSRKKGHLARDCRRPGRGGAEKGTKGDDGKKTSNGKGAVNKFDGNCRNCGKYSTFTGLEHAGRQVQRNQRRKALGTVGISLMSDEVENDWSKEGRRSGRNRQAKIGADRVEGALRVKVVDESKIQKFQMNERTQRKLINYIFTGGVKIVTFATKIMTGWMKVGIVGDDGKILKEIVTGLTNMGTVEKVAKRPCSTAGEDVCRTSTTLRNSTDT